MVKGVVRATVGSKVLVSVMGLVKSGYYESLPDFLRHSIYNQLETEEKMGRIWYDEKESKNV